MITNHIRRACIFGILSLLLLLLCSVSNAQDYYTGKDALVYKDAKYKITHSRGTSVWRIKLIV